MSNAEKKLIADKTTPGYWRITLNNPPINAITDGMYDEVYEKQQFMGSLPLYSREGAAA